MVKVTEVPTVICAEIVLARDTVVDPIEETTIPPGRNTLPTDNPDVLAIETISVQTPAVCNVVTIPTVVVTLVAFVLLDTTLTVMLSVPTPLEVGFCSVFPTPVIIPFRNPSKNVTVPFPARSPEIA